MTTELTTSVRVDNDPDLDFALWLTKNHANEKIVEETEYLTSTVLEEKIRPLPELDPCLQRVQLELNRLMRMHSAVIQAVIY